MLPDDIAVVHVNGHQKGSSFEAVGNRLADEAAWEAALQSELGEQLYILTARLPTPEQIPVFTEKETEELKRLGAIKTEEGRWLLPDGREMLNKQIMRDVMAVLHQGSHWGIQAMCDLMLRKHGCIGMYTIAKQISERCITCRKINKHVLNWRPPGGRQPGIRPF